MPASSTTLTPCSGPLTGPPHSAAGRPGTAAFPTRVSYIWGMLPGGGRRVKPDVRSTIRAIGAGAVVPCSRLSHGTERHHHGTGGRRPGCGPGGPGPGTGEPDRRPHRLQRRPGPAHGHRPGHRGRRCASRRRPGSCCYWSAIDPRAGHGCPSTSRRDPAGLGDRASRPGPAWPAAVVAQSRRPVGGVARVTSTLPVGAGLSSSAAFCVALALACGVEAPPVPMARLCQRAEAAAGADVGLMDPLVIAGGQAGHGPADRLRHPGGRSGAVPAGRRRRGRPLGPGP